MRTPESPYELFERWYSDAQRSEPDMPNAVALATAEVFAAYAADSQPPAAGPREGEAWSLEPSQFVKQLAAYRNDLSVAATALWKKPRF